MQLKDIVGNERLVKLLRRARPPRASLPQASLFAGPEGIGKRTLALALAALANCGQPEGEDLCGRCPSCIKAAAGNHPDIRVYHPEKNVITVDMMRDLSREAQFRPFEGQARVFIIDPAEKLNEAASNSILKILEEPPPTSKIVLISARPQKLLSTVRSRCQIFLFGPLTRKQIQLYLEQHGPSAQAGERSACARGSIGRAVTLDLEQLAGDRDNMLELFMEWFESHSFEAFYRRCEGNPLRGDLKKRERVLEYLEQIQLLAEDLYFLKVETEERVINQDRLKDLKSLSGKITLDCLREFSHQVNQARWEVEHYVNPLMSFETLWLKSV
ncbi:MAG: DNA polymerase III subunit delta' [Acidobacteriota bacterium]